jgi:hypothetical protein
MALPLQTGPLARVAEPLTQMMSENKFLLSVLGVIVAGWCSGCSLLVMQGGKRMDRVFTAGASDQKIRKSLGPPITQVAYPQPRAASEIPEIVKLAKLTPTLPLTNSVAGYEEYSFQGRVYQDESQGIVMVDTITFGAGELLLFPLSVRQAAQDRNRVHRFRVWYRPDRTYFAHVELVERKPVEEQSK